MQIYHTRGYGSGASVVCIWVTIAKDGFVLYSGAESAVAIYERPGKGDQRAETTKNEKIQLTKKMFKRGSRMDTE